MRVKDDPATRLRIAMDRVGLNVNELADLSRVSRNTISRLRTGQIKRPNWDTMMKICDVLGVRNPRDIWENF